LDFDELVNTYVNDMYATATRLTGSQQVAEDLVHDLFAQLQTRHVNTDHVQNPRAWLASILYRLFVDWWRREQRSPVKLWDNEKQMMDATEHVASEALDPLEYLERADESEKLLAALGRIGEDHRRMLIMHNMEGYTLSELQTILGLPLGTLKSRLHRGRVKLQNQLNAYAQRMTETTRVRMGSGT